MAEIEKKIARLTEIIGEFTSVMIAFSGGKDSFFLLQTALEVLGRDKVKTVFVNSDFIGDSDHERLAYFEEKFDLEIIRLEISVINDKQVSANPKDRCYICKTLIFKNIVQKATELEIDTVLDGTTFSDLEEYRPGITALEELKIVSPLRDAGITSAEIVERLQQVDIDPYYLSSSTCLATRFPYNFQLSGELIKRFDRIESFLVRHRIYPVRVRHIDQGIRIETDVENIPKLLEIKDQLISLGKEEEMKFITLDLEGLRSGVWDT